MEKENWFVATHKESDECLMICVDGTYAYIAGSEGGITRMTQLEFVDMFVISDLFDIEFLDSFFTLPVSEETFDTDEEFSLLKTVGLSVVVSSIIFFLINLFFL